jgi:hypothetical protein
MRRDGELRSSAGGFQCGALTHIAKEFLRGHGIALLEVRNEERKKRRVLAQVVEVLAHALANDGVGEVVDDADAARELALIAHAQKATELPKRENAAHGDVLLRKVKRPRKGHLLLVDAVEFDSKGHIRHRVHGEAEEQGRNVHGLAARNACQALQQRHAVTNKRRGNVRAHHLERKPARGGRRQRHTL